MPVYCYKCPNCTATCEHVRPVDERNMLPVCEACAPPLDHAWIPGTNCHPMERDITAENVHSANQEYERPVFSTSMGVAPKQVQKAQAIHPWMKYQPDGRIRIDSPAEYRKVRKALGMVDTSKR